MTGILKMYDLLQNEYSKTQTDLKEVDRSLRKLSGNRPTEGDSKSASVLLMERGGIKRKFFETNRYRNGNDDANDSDQRMATHKRPVLCSTIAKVSGLGMVMPIKRSDSDVEEGEEEQEQEEQEGKSKESIRKMPDGRGLARNRRMFGILMGTLQKFQSEESRRKEVTSKREKIDRKVEKAAEEEKLIVRQQREELFKNRRDKQMELRKIELKIERVKIHQEWEKSMQKLGDFIQTKTKPSIFYCPAKHTPETEKKLKDSKDKFKFMLAERRAKVQKDLAEIEERYKSERIESNEKKDEPEKENGKEERNGRNGTTIVIKSEYSDHDDDQDDQDDDDNNREEGELKNDKNDKEVEKDEKKSMHIDTSNKQRDVKFKDNFELTSQESGAREEGEEEEEMNADKSSNDSAQVSGHHQDVLEDKEFEPIYEE